MKRFYLLRYEDKSGISGTGVVAEGLLFSTGPCVISWLSDVRSVSVYDSFDDMIAIHGHGGKTEARWIDADTPTFSDL